MSAKQLVEFFEELISSPEKAQDIDAITQKSMTLFNEVMESLQNSSPREREKIQKELNEAAQNMQKGLENLCRKMGMTRDEMESMASDPSNFDPFIWDRMEAMKEELAVNQQSLVDAMFGSSEHKVETKKKSGKKTKKSKVKSFA